MLIRPAQKSDAPSVAPLLILASGDIASIMMGTNDQQQVLALTSQFFQAEGTRMSYQNMLVAEMEQQVVGMINLYHGSDATELDRPLVERLQQRKDAAIVAFEREADDDEWYIDTLAVTPQSAGHGIGSALIRAAEEYAQHARQTRCGTYLAGLAGPTKIALLVDMDNIRAYRLYQHLAYQQDKLVQLYLHPYVHMVKFFEPTSPK